MKTFFQFLEDVDPAVLDVLKNQKSQADATNLDKQIRSTVITGIKSGAKKPIKDIVNDAEKKAAVNALAKPGSLDSLKKALGN